MALVIAIFLAFVLGFAGHRASVCAVRAVAEFQHARTGFMAASIGKSMLWVILVTLPFFWFTAPSGPYLGGWALTVTAVVGGFLFGVGAGINGACAYSTMTRLADGEGRMAATILGFALGVSVFVWLIGLGTIERPMPAQTQFGTVAGWAVVILAILGALAIYELVGCGDGGIPASRFASVFWPRSTGSRARHCLSACAAPRSTCFSVRPATHRRSRSSIEGAVGTREWPATGRWLLLLAVLAGMSTSTLQRGTFRLDARPRTDWLRNAGGGMLMGLAQRWRPVATTCSSSMRRRSSRRMRFRPWRRWWSGIFGGLALMKALFRIEMRVSCRNDCYISG